MDDKQFDNSFVLELFNLDEGDVLSAKYINLDGNAVIDLFLTPNFDPCPDCHCDDVKIKGYVIKHITHSVLTDRKCTVLYHARRYVCSRCGRTFYEPNPLTFKGQKISILTVMNILRDLQDPSETFSSVAKRYHVSPTTVASIFDNHVFIPRKTLPEIINFDEVYAFKSKGSKFVCVLLDYKTGKPVDLLSSRRKDILESYFNKISYEERKNVKAVCFDMYTTYRDVAYRVFPEAIGIVDHFHLTQELCRQLDHIRIRTMKSFKQKSDEYYLLKKFNWLLYKDEDAKDKDGPLFDINRERKYNYHFKAYYNYYDLREMILKIDSELKKAYDFRWELKDYFDKETIETAESKLDELIESSHQSDIQELKHFSRTMARWRTEIINSFYVFDYIYSVDSKTGLVAVKDKKVTNAIIENRNSMIKILKKNASGYTNWERFRNRVMYVLDKDAHPNLYPIEKKGDNNNENHRT